MKSVIAVILPLLIIMGIVFIPKDLLEFETECTKRVSTFLPMQYAFIPMKDTIFLLGESYIELSLTEQTAKLISREDTIITFKISTGNSSLKKGMQTPTGIYTVQAKSPVAISKQFDNAELYNWVGFNGNIGIHGLKSNSYYYSLGIRPSSHGCVRIGREDGEKLYRMVKRGTPVLVIDSLPARILAFADYIDINPARDIMYEDFNAYQKKILRKRLKNLYNGKANYNNYCKIFLDGKTIIRSGGIEIGETIHIASKQEISLLATNFITLESDILSYNRYGQLVFPPDTTEVSDSTAAVFDKSKSAKMHRISY